MILIEDIAPLRRLGNEPIADVLRSVYLSFDHTFAPSALEDPESRALLYFVDALVHGLVSDPILGWSAITATGLGRTRHSPTLDSLQRWTETASRRTEWFNSQLEVRLRRPAPAMLPQAGLARLSTRELAAHLGLQPPPDATPSHEALTDEVMRRALALLGTHATPKTMLGFHVPYVPLVYSTTPAQQAQWQQELERIADTSDVPVIPIEPFDFWGTADLRALSGRPVVFSFSSHNALWHALAVPGVLDLLAHPDHGVFVAGDYPHESLGAVLRGGSGAVTCRPALTPVHPSFQERLPSIAEALTLLSQHLCDHEPIECPDAQWLFELGLNLKHDILARRYGSRSACPLRRLISLERWYSPHKAPPPAGRPTYPPLDHIGQQLDPELPRPARRTLSRGPRRHIVHVVSQVVDSGHAPSTLLRTLIERSSRDRWDVSVVSLETGARRRDDYPRPIYASEFSDRRAPGTIEAWRSGGVEVHLCVAPHSSDDAVREAVQVMADRNADISIFHGNDPSLLLCAARCDVPRRVFFEHSGLALQRDFDLAISPITNAAEKYARRSADTGVPVVTLPYCSTARSTWQGDPPDLGVGPGIRLLTTISNHLENRVTGVFVEAVATILQICPNAVYAPIGRVSDPEAFRLRFAPWNVANRIFCVGAHSAPSQLCRSMHIYLNEFPFGSGIAITDAMAAGLPVVTMYDPHGPLQAQNGAIYMGADWTVTSLDPVDYVTLACQLIQDDARYSMWSAHSLERFEGFGPARYVEGFENILTERLLTTER